MVPSLSGHVRWCSVEGSVIVLDVLRGEYFALDPDASRTWRNFADGAVTPDQPFLTALDRLDWLGEAASRPSSQGKAVRLLAKVNRRLLAFACILSARWRLKRHGFSGAYAWAETWGQTSPAPGAAIAEDLRSFVGAEALLPSRLGERDCLPRSLALFVYLRALGHPARHVIGVARFPFDAHAWVELEDRAMLEYRVEQKLLAGARTPRGRTPIAVIA